MIASRSTRRRVSRRGYTLIELIVACFLTIQIGMVLVLTWKAFGVSAVQVEERARLTVNANLAAESMTHDWSGYQVRAEALPSPNQSTSVDRLYRFQSRLSPDSNHPYPLRLQFQRVDQTSSTITISYNCNSTTSRLIRYDETAGTSTTVATHVTILEVDPVVSGETSFNISFTVSYREFTGKYTLNMQYPQ